MSEKKETKTEKTPVLERIQGDGVIDVPNIAKPENPPGLRPVNSNPQPQGQQRSPSTGGGESTGGEDN